jgi:hypothetical protein
MNKPKIKTPIALPDLIETPEDYADMIFGLYPGNAFIEDFNRVQEEVPREIRAKVFFLIRRRRLSPDITK